MHCPADERKAMSNESPNQRVSLESAVRACRGFWDTRRALTALRDAGHQPKEKHTRQILRDLASSGLLIKVEDWPVRYRTDLPGE